MKSSKLIIGVVFSALFSGAVVAHGHGNRMACDTAGWGMHQMSGHGPRMMERIFNRLDLTREQEEALKALHDDNRDETKATYEQMKALHDSLRDLMHADEVNESAIKSMVTQIAELKAQLMIQHAKVRQQAIALLNDEQRAKFNDMQTKRMEKMGHWLDEPSDDDQD